MEADYFDHEYAEQTAYLRRQLSALRKQPRKIRGRYQALVVRCKECGDVVLEVLNLDPYMVVSHRQRKAEHIQLPSSRASKEETEEHWRDHFADRTPSLRLDKDWRFFPIADQTTGDEQSRYVYCACRCSGEKAIAMVWIRSKVESGARHATL